jgi:hypothetical protein
MNKAMASLIVVTVRERYREGGDTSNTPLVWTGHHEFSASPPQAPCLPLKASVSRIPGMETEPCSAGLLHLHGLLLLCL